jgi:apolipoprotein N-acyltransferase
VGATFHSVPVVGLLAFPEDALSYLGLMGGPIWPWSTSGYAATPDAPIIWTHRYLGILVLAFWLHVTACLIVELARKLRSRRRAPPSRRKR